MTDAAALLDHPLVGRRLFFPRVSREAPTLAVDAGGCRLACHVRRADPGAGWVVHFHGNGELAADSARCCAELFTGAGVNVCFVEYRGYGASGGEPALAAMLGDGERVVAALGVDPRRTVAFGRSLGSLYAVELARRLPSLGGLVLESGVADPAELRSFAAEAEAIGCAPGAVEAALGALFDQPAKLAGYAGPLLVLHAAADRHVDPSHAERLCAWGGGPDKRLVLFPHGDHNSILRANRAAYEAELRAFFGRAGLTRDAGAHG